MGNMWTDQEWLNRDFSTDIKSVFYIPQAKQDKILEHVLTLAQFVLAFQTFQACIV